MPCIDLAMPPDHNMVLNEAVEVPSWMSTSFGQDLGCSLSYVDRLMVPPNRNKKLKKVRVLVLGGLVLGSVTRRCKVAMAMNHGARHTLFFVS